MLSFSAQEGKSEEPRSTHGAVSPGAHLDEPEEQRFVEADYFMDKRPEVTIRRSKPYVCRRSFDHRWWQD
jgi:hypothetical protein